MKSKKVKAVIKPSSLAAGKDAPDTDDLDDNDPTSTAPSNAARAELAAELADEFEEGVSIAFAIKHLPSVPTVREVRRLFDYAKKDARDYLILRIFYYTGVRLAELEKLCFADVNDDGLVLVREGKGGIDRYVCVDAQTLKLIRDAQGDRPVSDRIIDIHARQIGNVVHHYGRLSGLVQKAEAMNRTFSPHALRHAFATHRYEAGMDLFVLMKLLGHRYLSTTMVYVQTSMRQELKQYRKSDPFHGK